MYEDEDAGDLERRSCFDGGEGDLLNRKEFGVRKPAFVDADILIGKDDEEDWDVGDTIDFIFTPVGDADEDTDADDGVGGVKNKGSVEKLLYCWGDSIFAGVVLDNCVIAAELAIIVGSDVADFFPVVVVVEVLPHIEDNTKAAATVWSWL